MSEAFNPQQFQKRIIFTSVFMMLVTSITLAAFTYFPMYQIIKDQGLQNLQTEAKFQASKVDHYIEECSNLAKQIVSRTKARLELESYNQSKSSLTLLQQALEPIAHDAFRDTPQLKALTRLDASGKAVFSQGVDIPASFYLQKNLSHIQTLPFLYNQNAYLMLATDIFNRSRQKVGQDLILCDLIYLQKDLNRNEDLGQSLEVLVIYQKDSEIHSLFQTPLKERVLGTKKTFVYQQVQKALDNKTPFVMPHPQYTSHTFAYYPLQSMDWGVLITIDNSYLNASLESQFLEILILLVVFLFIGTLCTFLLVLPLTGKNLKYANQLSQNINQQNRTIKKERKALNNFQSNQAKLIQMEKLSALGQLIAGIAHEINTPIGAIRASIGNINQSLENIAPDLFQLFSKLSESEQQCFFRLLEKSTQPHLSLSTREERKLRRTLQSRLEAENIEDADMLAEQLVEVRLGEEFSDIVGCIHNPNFSEMLALISRLYVQHRHSKNIEFAVDRVSKIVFSLKHFVHSGNPEEKTLTSLSEDIDVVLTLYHNQLKQGVEVTREFENLPQIFAYADQLKQVWTNLIHNAIQAMEGKGSLDIRIFQKGHEVIVEIQDSGKGIPDDIKDQIFEPFFTTKAAGEGTGIGLGIVKNIIQKHGGSIGVQSEPGKTTFRVSLPLDQATKESVDQK